VYEMCGTSLYKSLTVTWNAYEPDHAMWCGVHHFAIYRKKHTHTHTHTHTQADKHIRIWLICVLICVSVLNWSDKEEARLINRLTEAGRIFWN